MKQLLLQKKQFLVYCVIGLSGATLDFCLYSFLVNRGLAGYEVGNAISYGTGTVFSFILNARYNFRVTDRIVQRLATFLGVGFLGLLVSAGVLYVLISEWHVNKYEAKFASLVVIVLLQYNLNRVLSFRKVN